MNAPAGPTRRRVLVGATLGVLLGTGLVSCTKATGVAAPSATDPDEPSVDRTVIDTRQLQAEALAMAARHRKLAGLLTRIAAVHASHLVALGAAPTAVPSASPSATTPTYAQSPSELVKAEWATARTALRDGEAAAPAFAVLLCRIAAARAVNADLLNAAIHGRAITALTPAPVATVTPSGSAATSATGSSAASVTDTGATSATGSAASATGSTATAADPSGATGNSPAPGADPSATGTATSIGSAAPPATAAPAVLAALNRLLAGEHAAVYAYPLVITRGPHSKRTLAAELWQAHRTERDELAVRLHAAGVVPVAADPAYQVGRLPTTTAKAAALAARIESGLAALATDVIAAGPAAVDPDRALGANQLVLSARRTADWTGRPNAFPGLITTPTPTPTASP